MALARYVHRFADVNGQGEVTRDDLLRFVRDEGLFSDYEDGRACSPRTTRHVVAWGFAFLRRRRPRGEPCVDIRLKFSVSI